MSTPLSPPPYLKGNVLSSLGMIVAVVSLSEALTQLLLIAAVQWGFVLSPVAGAIANIALLAALATPLLWLLALRPLALPLAQEQTASNRELLDALENHVLVSIADVQGRIVYANEMFCKVSGFALNELVGQDHRIVNSGHHDRDYIRSVWRTIAGGQVWRGEFCNRRKNGELYWVDSTIAPVLDNAGRPKHYISIRRDTTMRKANELKLTALKRALDASSEMILITDADGFIQYANPALCQFTGWAEQDLLGQKPYLLDCPNTDPHIMDDMQARLRRGEAWSGRLRGCRRSAAAAMPESGCAGQAGLVEYWAKTNITPILAADGALSGYVQIQHDVSKQVEEETALQIEADDAAARLAISEALHQPLSLQQRFVQVLDIIFGLKSCGQQRNGSVLLRTQDDDGFELVAASCGSDFNCQDWLLLPLYKGLCQRVAASKELVVVPSDERGGQGYYAIPIASGEDVLGMVLVVTEPHPVQSESRIAMLKQVGEMIALALLQRQANISLEAARDAALQVAQSKTEFLANMSHEIRTPMNGVLGMLDLLQDTQLSREQWDLVNIAANSAESLLTIINDILDFSKLEAGKIEVEQIAFNLPDLVEEVCTLLSSRAHNKGLELNCFLPANLPLRWQGDPTRIRQVLTNLIGNAVKFTERGEVSVKVSVPETGGIGLRFDVTDTGIGIAAEAQARLFQAFSQADSSTSRRYGGTGLGLSISKDLVMLMNGSIGVDSALGQGAKFWFVLPLLPMDSESPPPQLNFAGKRALIVDDNATNRMILAHYLGSWGFVLNQVDNGPAALAELDAAALRNEPYDLLLSDMQMPDMDGFALARAILEKPAIAGIPRILLSSGNIGLQRERSALGFSQSLLKPVRQSQLFDAVIDALQLPDQKITPLLKGKEGLPNYGDKRVLVVEDNKVNQKVILSQLAKFQLKPDLANNGQEALEWLARQAYHLVLMDCQMPVMDGYEATHILREQEIAEAKPRTVIVALTAHASAGEREKCLALGMDDYLSKPINRADLAVVLMQWLGVPSMPGSGQDYVPDIPHNPALVKGEAKASACWDEEATLKRLDGDADLLDEMVDLLLETAPVQLAELADALSRCDVLALADSAHAIKGMAGHFCAEKTINCAVNLEQAARSGAVADFQRMGEELAQATLGLVESLQQRTQQVP
ncbi:MAG: response regulator [Methylobacter sp.]|nr:response regulator [Methylobacter sp.]MDP2097407.1 response regulator [Methylobacter sp.]MDP2428603.1 response regulator [Methylobacter sp.]MDP3056439.1 response regulator [Methylobacter sp.]MDP3363185.1 response regulator [Methylobacter sp.]